MVYTPEQDRFEDFMRDLHEVPWGQVELLLDRRIDSVASQLTNPETSQSKATEAIKNFALLSMAKTAQLTDKAKHYPILGKEPAWISTSRELLRCFAFRNDLINYGWAGVFLLDDPDVHRGLTEVVDAAVKPAGNYTNRAFVAGVALGKIELTS